MPKNGVKMPETVSPYQPLNIRIMDVDAEIKQNGYLPVTSLAINEPSSPDFHPDGLFSEEIFGAIGSRERTLERFGYIELNTTILAPVIYRHVVKLSGLYEEIMSGATYAVFDEKEKDFVRVSGDPESTDGAATGYSFFISKFDDIVFKDSDSIVRKNRIALIKKFRGTSMCKRFLVVPAGLREMEQDDVKMASDDINNLYRSLLGLTMGLRPGTVSVIFDSVRFKIQTKANEIFAYIENIVSEKNGFLQGGGYGSRNIALGTRNVITAADYVMEDPDDPKAIQPNETKTGILQTAVGLKPAVTYVLRTVFFDPTFGGPETSKVPLINPKGMALQYAEVDALEKAKFLSGEGVEKWINKFRNTDVRFSPVVVRDINNTEYYLFLVYDQVDRISIFRSLNDLKSYLPEGEEVDMDKVRPITWAELLYIATYNASATRYCMVTRYPVIEEGSCYPSKIHLMSTAPARTVRLHDMINGVDVVEYPEYPVLKDSTFLDSVVVHSSSLPGLGGD